MSSNDDIFNIVKADVLLQFYILGLAAPEELRKMPIQHVWLQYIIRNPLAFSSHLATALSKAIPFTEKVSGVMQAISDLVKDVNEFEEKLTRESQPEAVRATEFVESLHQSASSVWESGVVADYIRSIISRQREAGKAVLLVVDDLDRLDPEHIFRIMNIFSAHMESDSDENKFGFDKIILVCDVNNIRLIYQHRYGALVDFEGYIDKFLSEEHFEFSISDTVTEYCRTSSSVSNPSAQVVLQILLSACADKGWLTVRQLMRAKVSGFDCFIVIHHPVDVGLHHSMRKLGLTDLTHFTMTSDDVAMMQVVKQLCSVFGSIDALLEVLNKLTKVDGSIQEDDRDSVARAFYIPSLLSRKLKNPVEMFFQKYGVDAYGQKEINTTEPEFTLGDRFVTLRRNLNTIANSANDAKRSWFEGSQYNVHQSDKGNALTIAALSQNLKEFCELLRARRFTHMMGISSAT
ncbi:MAG: hypothetical protein KA175_00845 [Flavobacteriales bacterium]|nr:hypothetical protein [Flavobacteriales bacterium]MBP6696130.1 hypothetical protein [Flavobacteriales bacterium]